MGKKKEEEVKELMINPVFEPLFDDYLEQPRYYQVYGGRGSAKSATTALAVIKLTYSPFKHKVLYLRQTMTSLEDSSIADVRWAIEFMGVGADFKESKGQIINKVTGSTISFKGIRSSGSQTAKLKSLSGITTLVIEEAEEVESFEEFSKVDESIRIKGKPLKIIMVYNPTSAIKSWIHKEWFTNGFPNIERYDDTMFMHSTYKDNIENLNPSVVKRYEKLATTNPTYYKNTILAEWTLEVANRMYDGWGQIPLLEEPGDTWYGLDFGYGGKDQTACIKITWIDGVYYVELMFAEAKLSIRSTLTKLRKSGVPVNARIYADSAMPLLIEEIRQGGYSGIRKCHKGNVEGAIKKVQDKDITMVGDSSTQLYYDYMTFQRDSKGKLPHEPDTLAALRYGILSKKPTKNPTKIKKRPARRRDNSGYSGTPLH